MTSENAPGWNFLHSDSTAAPILAWSCDRFIDILLFVRKINDVNES